ncbi:hypothetical protein, partial [Massilimicrobiota timonensis]|uniref:hypothetical protein n=1 Tax=Massilimicrobiota timonensis TaxID=1776392 RepID=UPI00195FE740
MSKISVTIMIDIKFDNPVFDIERYSGSRSFASVAMNKSSFTIFFIFKDESIDSSDSTSQLDGSSIFIA